MHPYFSKILQENIIQLSKKDFIYSAFFGSTNDREEILKNYKAAVTACKSAVKLMKSVPPSTRAYRCGLNAGQGTKIWEKRLQFLLDENIMLKDVNSGNLSKDIYDVIKLEVFDKKQKVKSTG